MPQMTDPATADDPHLWAIAYLTFFVRDADAESRKNRRLLELEPRYTAMAVGDFTLFLMDAVWLPLRYGVHWTDSWVDIDSRRRTEPALRSALAQRERYKRLGKGHTVRPKLRLRQTAKDAIGMLWLEYQAECAPGPPLLYGSVPVLKMLDGYRLRFGCSSGSSENA